MVVVVIVVIVVVVVYSSSNSSSSSTRSSSSSSSSGSSSSIAAVVAIVVAVVVVLYSLNSFLFLNTIIALFGIMAQLDILARGRRDCRDCWGYLGRQFDPKTNLPAD